MSKIKFILPLILILLISISALAAVEFEAIEEFKSDGETYIAMTAPVGTSVGDLLIAYISKDDDVAIYDEASYGDWNMVFNNIANGATTLYIAWKWAVTGDANQTTEYTWNADSEDWLGEIICYSGVKAETPIHGTSGISVGDSTTPTAPSVAFEDLAVGSLALQVMGIDQDEAITTPAQLTQRFNAQSSTDIGGAGGEKALTPWDVSTAGYADKSKLVALQEANPYKGAFSSDGTKMYIIGYSHKTVFQYTLTTAWDVSTADYADKSKDVSAQDTNPFGVEFSSDGTKMYIVGVNTGYVYQYTLTTAWDVSTASYADKSKDVSAQDTIPWGIAFSSDGAKMYMSGVNTGYVYQYTLTTAWDVSTASYADKSKDVREEDSTCVGIAFSSDGTKMYMLGYATCIVFQYTLTTEWDISTAGYANRSILVSAQDTKPRDVIFSSDGTKMYIVGEYNRTVYQYALSETGTAVFTATSRAWAAATLVIEASSEAPPPSETNVLFMFTNF